MLILYIKNTFIFVNNQLDAQNFCFTISLFRSFYMFRAPCAHRQEVKIALHSLWYHHTETSEWSKITKIHFCKYEQTVVKLMCEFFWCDYCVLLTINMLCHVQVMFIQMLNSLERYYIYIYPDDEHICSKHVEATK